MLAIVCAGMYNKYTSKGSMPLYVALPGTSEYYKYTDNFK